MATPSRVKLSHVLALVGVLALLAGMLLPAMCRAREEPHGGPWRRCRNNLNQIAKGMATYLMEFGDNRFYPWPAGRVGCGSVADPAFGGAEWLASLYWTKIIPDPGVFVCPKCSDDNDGGRQLGSSGTPGGRPLSPHAVSYAGFGNKSVGIYMASKLSRGANYASSDLPVREDFPSDAAMACDDTQPPVNHGRGGCMTVLFFDSHTEFWWPPRVDLEAGVGQGDLCALRN